MTTLHNQSGDLEGRGSKILVGITTYAGDFEQRLILRKVVRHLRYMNRDKIDVLLVSDGLIEDPYVLSEIDFLLDRPGPSGLQQGELDSIGKIVQFASENGYEYVIKSAGDIIMSAPNWAEVVMNSFLLTGKRMLSTHWFEDHSWVVGTKFFVADVGFLKEVLPKDLQNQILEAALTQSISAHYNPQEVLYLINSNTGERDEVKAELSEWGWEHAHRLSKFIEIDFGQPLHVRLVTHILAQILRIKRDIARILR